MNLAMRFIMHAYPNKVLVLNDIKILYGPKRLEEQGSSVWLNTLLHSEYTDKCRRLKWLQDIGSE